MTHWISYSRAAAKAFRGNQPQEARRIKVAIVALALDPRPEGEVQLVAGDGEMRVRVGNYRIVYDIDDGELIILVLRIATAEKCIDDRVQRSRRCWPPGRTWTRLDLVNVLG